MVHRVDRVDRAVDLEATTDDNSAAPHDTTAMESAKLAPEGNALAEATEAIAAEEGAPAERGATANNPLPAKAAKAAGALEATGEPLPDDDAATVTTTAVAAVAGEGGGVRQAEDESGNEDCNAEGHGCVMNVMGRAGCGLSQALL